MNDNYEISGSTLAILIPLVMMFLGFLLLVQDYSSTLDRVIGGNTLIGGFCSHFTSLVQKE